MSNPPLIHRLVRAIRLDELLALLFTGALLLLAALGVIPVVPAALRYFLALMTWYGLMFALTRAIAGVRSLPVPAKRAILSSILLLLALFTIVAPGELSLETLKNLVVLTFPVAIGWWVTPLRQGEAAVVGPSGSALSLLRDFAPFLVSEAAYLALHDVVHRVSPVDRDGWLIAADDRLFGGAATQWLEPYVRPWLTEWFSATYSLFVFFPLTLALWFAARGARGALRHLLLSVVLCNYLGYLGYLLVPAIGPMYTLSYGVPLSGGWFYQIKESLDQLARVPRDCFPSLHTANTFVVLLMVWSYARPLSWIYLPLGGSCIAATIYLRYHYSVDVLAGFVLGGVVTWAVPKLAYAWHAATLRWTGYRGEARERREERADSL